MKSPLVFKNFDKVKKKRRKRKRCFLKKRIRRKDEQNVQCRQIKMEGKERRKKQTGWLSNKEQRTEEANYK